MDSTCLQRLRRRELEGGYTIPRRTCRGRPIVCPGPCNPRFKSGQRQEGRHTGETSKAQQQSPRTEATYEQVYGQETSYEQGITYEETTYDGETVETIAVDQLTTYNEMSLETTSSKQVLPGRGEVSKGPSHISGRSAASSPREATARVASGDPSGKLSSKPSARTDGGTTAGQSVGQAVASIGQTNGEMTGADCRRCFVMCLKAFFRATVKLVKKLGGSAGMVETSPCAIGLAIFVGFHGLLAIIAWQMPQYQVFLSSQICGLLAVLSLSITGTIPLLDTRPTDPPCVCRPCA